MSRFTRIRNSVRMSHDWPRRAFQAARHGDSLSDLLRDVPGHRGFTSQLDSLIGNDEFANFFSWIVPRIIGGGFAAAAGLPIGAGTAAGGMLDKSEQSEAETTTTSIPTPAPPGQKSFSFTPINSGGPSLMDLFSMRYGEGGGGRNDVSSGQQNPYIGGRGFI